MPTLNIGGQRVKVDDSFLQLSPEQRNATVEEISKSLPQQPSIAGDIVKSAGTGLVEGTASMAGMAGDINSVLGSGAAWVLGKIAGDNPTPNQQEAIEAVRRGPLGLVQPHTSSELVQRTESVVGPLHQPETTAGEYARTAGQFLPGIAFGEGGLARRAITQAIIPAAVSETAGQATKGSAVEPYARIAGALAGGVAPSAASRAITPFPANPTKQAMARVLQGEGVDLTAGQKTGNRTLKAVESELGGGKAADFMDKQGEQFTKATLSRAGITADRATPEVIDHAFGRIGQQFDDLAARNSLIPDQQLASDLASIRNEYNSVTSSANRAPIVENTLADIASHQGPITGDWYKTNMSRLAALARGTKDSELANALLDIRGAMDDAMERSIAANNPADLGGWKNARREYRNMLVIEKAATAAGEKAAEGIISPSALRNAVTNQSRRAYARGKGDFAELARAGESVMKPLPDSGTPVRSRAQQLGMGVSAMMGAGAGAGVGGSSGAMAGALLGAAIPGMIGRAALSGPGRAYLGNQLLTQYGPITSKNAPFIAALLATEQQARPAIAKPVE